MPNMSRYCKAVPRERFDGYDPFVRAIATDPSATDGERPFYYLHDSFVVTKDTFVDTEIVFDAVTPEWVTFCRDVLAFNPEQALGPSASSGSGEEAKG